MSSVTDMQSVTYVGLKMMLWHKGSAFDLEASRHLTILLCTTSLHCIVHDLYHRQKQWICRQTHATHTNDKAYQQ